MDFEEFELAIYRRPAEAPALSEEELQANRRAHHGYLAQMREAGHIVTNAGVLDDPAAEPVQGLVVYATGSLEETRRLVDGDPAIAAGRFVADVVRLRCAPGTMVRAGRPVEA